MDYKGVLGEYESELTVCRSRFIATAARVANSVEAIDFVNRISKKYSDATHNCYGYIANPKASQMKFSDANEPQGTAGQPILEVIKKRNLACTAVVVTRYYGGIKLGKGGLVAAYTKATKECLDNACIVEYKMSSYKKVKTDYSHKKNIEKAIKSIGGDIVEILYLNDVEIIYAIPIDYEEVSINGIMSVTKGQAEIENLYKKYYIYK